MTTTNKPNVLVIGGTGGIGFAIAKFYADRGSKVVITGRDAERTAGVAKEVGGDTRGIGLDVAEPERVEEALKSIEHIDYLALVAVERDYNSAREYDIARARRIVTMKLIGYTEAAHSLYPRMGAGASAVLFGGLASERPYPGSTSITTVNGAVSSLIRTLAVELAPEKIRVNCINPALAETPLLATFLGGQDTPEVRARFLPSIPIGRLGRPADVANAALFFADPAAEFVTGVCLEVDGGRCI